jgi:peptidoglycan-associated lipoprotein
MSAAAMSSLASFARAGLFAGLLVAAASCTTTKLETPQAPPNQGGYTNDPADGFENVQPGSEEDFILNVGRRTYFTEGSAALDSVAKVTLDKQAEFLLQNPKWYAKIQGFADDPGGNAKMVQLSQKRADTTMAYLISKGVPADRLWAKGYGKERVVRECTERACKVQNRRVITNLRDTRVEPEGD